MKTATCTPVRLGPEDVDDLIALEAQCFSTSWTRDQFLHGLDDNAIIAFGLRESDGLIAYMTFYASYDEAEIINIGVRPERRSQGHGTRLLGLVLQICGKMGIKHMFLEVRRSNTAARRLYDRHGFIQVGMRQGYYQGGDAQADEREDALVMRRDFA